MRREEVAAAEMQQISKPVPLWCVQSAAVRLLWVGGGAVWAGPPPPPSAHMYMARAPAGRRW